MQAVNQTAMPQAPGCFREHEFSTKAPRAVLTCSECLGVPPGSGRGEDWRAIVCESNVMVHCLMQAFIATGWVMSETLAFLSLVHERRVRGTVLGQMHLGKEIHIAYIRQPNGTTTLNKAGGPE